MAIILDEISRTFQEYLLLPGCTTTEHTHDKISLKAPIQRYHKSEGMKAKLNIPIVSSAMQAVTGSKLSVALARKGGCGFIFCSQSIEDQAKMVRQVKEHKAGFVESDSNLSPSATLADVIELRNKTGHSTIAITEDGGKHSKLLGLLTSKDFWEFKDDLSKPVSEYYTPSEKLIFGEVGISLQEATDKLWQSKKECLPIIDKNGALHSLVFRKDFYDHKTNPDELTDDKKKLFVGAALNTYDYMDRAGSLIEAGVDVMVLDSSDGYGEWQKNAALELREEYGSDIILGGGNVVTAEAFRYLADVAKVDFVKVGIGGGSICITREQKGIGRGQASSVMEVAKERDKYFQETGHYIPICSDGGLSSDTQIIIALAMGADFVMMGRYFAMTSESPTPKISHKGRVYKPYWGEGSNRARNWQRYSQSSSKTLTFEEGVDAYVPYSGNMSETLDVTVLKLKSTMSNVGVNSLNDFHKNAKLVRVSEMTLVESGTGSVEQLDRILSEEK